MQGYCITLGTSVIYSPVSPPSFLEDIECFSLINQTKKYLFPQIFIFIKLFVCADVFEIGWGLEILHPYNGFFYMKNIYLFSGFLLF